MNHLEEFEFTDPVKTFKEKDYENTDITAFFILNFVQICPFWTNQFYF